MSYGWRTAIPYIYAKTLDLMSHYLTSDHPEEMAGSLVNFLLLQITEIFHSQNVHPAGRVRHSDALFRLFRKLLAENYRKVHDLQFYADSLNVSQTYLSREWYARFLEKQ